MGQARAERLKRFDKSGFLVLFAMKQTGHL
jgi:hypothetical protein